MPNFDFRCSECAHIFDAVEPGVTDLIPCESCGGYAERIWLSAPGVLLRPDGYARRPDEPGYSTLPKTDRTVKRWQLGRERQRASR